jgi:predicted nucleotidyltransferase
MPTVAALDVAAVTERLRTLPEVVFACLLGIAARGELGPLSDVDVAVFLAAGLDALTARADLCAAVTGHLGTDRVLVDLRVLCDKRPFLRHRFESRALREFHDFRVFEHRLLGRRRG